MKDIFSYNVNTIEKTAYMNWRTQRFDHINNMIVVAEGFSDSALLLVKEILKDNTDKKADNLIFPILFNANHDLKGLFKKVVDLENELKNSNDEAVFHEMMSNLKAYIYELYGKIERTIKDKKGNDKPIYDITFCRYTLTLSKDLEPQFYINTFDNVVVDLENFLTVFKDIFDNLRSLSMHYSNLLETKQENEYEARQLQVEMESEFRGDY
ncbi:hypothetical protein [Sporosarcina sp. FSL K6-5500]|uniref:hypothetical protein n=1 Tax=Sporosarcina sp. FSL K6-5500 TaxID=2921558 RepID=UPI0030F77B3D